jgi:hypothetical protein
MNNVLDALDTDRKADTAICDSDILAFEGSERTMRRDCWIAHL